ncbi:NrdR family transcriptional regulator [Methylobacterium sp. Leaf118]|uniref:NrdR family transcriptional regulator n=1 Tax=Methylobacterium sp. Leaf118 TaxID=2876562 RepID=UPI003FA57875
MIPCPACGWPTSRVLDSRDVPGAVRRRRRCLRCATTWGTQERAEEGSERRPLRRSDRQRAALSLPPPPVA